MEDTARYGEDAVWLKAEIDAWWEAEQASAGDDQPYEFCDSFRLALKGNAEEEAAFDAAVTCCGSVDVELGPSPLGNRYIYGFNHGH